MKNDRRIHLAGPSNLRDKSMEHINETEWNALLAGTCTPDQSAWIDEHVEQCPECRQRTQSIHDVEDRLAHWQVNTAGHDVSVRVMQAVLNETSSFRPSWHRRIVSYALKAAALLLIGAGLGFWAGNQSAQQYIAKQAGGLVETEPSYLAAIDLQLASGLTWSVLSDNPSGMEGNNE